MHSGEIKGHGNSSGERLQAVNGKKQLNAAGQQFRLQSVGREF